MNLILIGQIPIGLTPIGLTPIGQIPIVPILQGHCRLEDSDYL
jgi:hypothetical protein